jgi:hypothetical protein
MTPFTRFQIGLQIMTTHWQAKRPTTGAFPAATDKTPVRFRPCPAARSGGLR